MRLVRANNQFANVDWVERAQEKMKVRLSLSRRCHTNGDIMYSSIIATIRQIQKADLFEQILLHPELREEVMTIYAP